MKEYYLSRKFFADLKKEIEIAPDWADVIGYSIAGGYFYPTNAADCGNVDTYYSINRNFHN
jgi:hypothetical protein